MKMTSTFALALMSVVLWSGSAKADVVDDATAEGCPYHMLVSDPAADIDDAILSGDDDDDDDRFGQFVCVAEGRHRGDSERFRGDGRTRGEARREALRECRRVARGCHIVRCFSRDRDRE